MMASDLEGRQIWWAFAVAGGTVGLALIVFSPKPLWKLAGALLAVIPHIVGPPHPAMVEINEIASSVPAEMAARFAVTSLITVGLFWVALGALVAYFYDRFSDE
jgi:predicted cobalt transporter CbtA